MRLTTRRPREAGPYRRFRLVLAGFGAVIALALLLAPSCGRHPRKPNLLLVTIDTLRADHLGCYGDSAASTPNLDRLAADGVVFERALTPVPLTLPSHASVLTGLLPPRHGVRNNGSYHLSRQIATVTERLEAGGYRTGAFVSSFVLHRQFGLDQGFEAYDDSLFNERPGTETVARALAFCDRETGKGRRPFFLWVHLFEPHMPWIPPPPYASMPLPSGYDREVAAADGALGLLLSGLKERRLLENTAVIVAGDHGEGLGDHGEMEHGIFLYSETIHVPLLVRLPERRDAGRRVADPVSLVDIAPTLLDLAGLPPLAVSDGSSLRPALEGGAVPERTGFYLETVFPKESFGWSPLFGFEETRWKWIRAPRSELYALDDDPGERSNLAEAAPDTATRLDRRLERARLALQPLVPGGAEAMSGETAERLRSLGYLSASDLAVDSDSGLPDPKDMIAFHDDFETGSEALDDRRYNAAVAAFRRVVAHDTGNKVALLGLGQALLRTGRYDEAEEIYRRSLKLSPENSTALFGLADALFGEERWSEALEIYRLAGRDPQLARSVATRSAICLDHLGRAADAEAVLQEAKKARPAEGAYYDDIGRRLAERRALQNLSGAGGSAADTLDLARARAAAGLGLVAEAERLLARSFRDPGAERRRLELRETLYSELNRPEKALDALRTLLRRDGSTPERRLREATLLMEAGRPEEADTVFERIDGRKLADPSARGLLHFNHACALARLGRTAEAVAALRRAAGAGYGRLGSMLNDPDLRSIQEDPAFRALIDSLSVGAAAAARRR